ncbi:MAG: hypothetical protein HOH58_17950 [Opitutaceae bacterium]|jgi:hypothetical protein|nr:hypothetical protein [Opitutaceae bacterium]
MSASMRVVTLLGFAAITVVPLIGSEPPGPDWELHTPTMTEGPAAAGRRVRVTAPEYVGTEVYHSLYLPTDWTPEGSFPVIVEYTGNYWPPAGSTGEAKDANLGYGWGGSKGFIWVVMPYVEVGRKENAVTWWGDKQATVDYCKLNLPRICAEYGGDLDNVFVTGFSRGAIGTSYIGLADDEIAALWRGFMTYDHFDGAKSWSYPESDQASALDRLARLDGRPFLVAGGDLTRTRTQFLDDHLELADFTFLEVPVAEIFNIPEGRIIHPHTDLWMHQPSRYRDQMRRWLRSAIKR